MDISIFFKKNLPLNCLLHNVMLVLVLHPFFYGLLVLQIWWPPVLSIVIDRNANCSHGGRTFLCKFCYFNTLFGAHQVEDVILVIFKLSNFFFCFQTFSKPEIN
jgi:hypothetical protein